MYENIMQNILPDALLIGVDYHLFWTLTPKSMEPFIRAFKRKEERRQEQFDIIAWQIGGYVRQAIASSFDKNTKYPKEPYSQIESKVVVDEDISQDIIKRNFMSHMKMLNSRF